MKNEYYKNNLTSKNQELYRKCLDAIQTYTNELKIMEDISDVDMKMIERAIRLDHPELFFWKRCKTENNILKQLLYGNTIFFEYYFVGNQAEAEIHKLRFRVKKQLESVNGQNLTERQKIEKICYMIWDTKKYVSSDISDVAKNTAYGAFVKMPKHNYTGIALTVKYIMDLINIECIVVDGKDKNNERTMRWNIVWIDGKPYNMLFAHYLVTDKRPLFQDFCMTNKAVERFCVFNKDIVWPDCNYIIDERSDFPVSSPNFIEKSIVKTEEKSVISVDENNNSNIIMNSTINNRVEDNRKKYEVFDGKTIDIQSNSEIGIVIEKNAANLPFDFALHLVYKDNLNKIGSKISDFILRRFILKGVNIHVFYKCYQKQNIIHIYTKK